MGQEFFINSQELEDKIRQLLPSQGGAGSGFDLSASTQIVPIIDLTESAEGSNLRQDLQSSMSHDNATVFNVEATTTTVITTTGYWRILGTSNLSGAASTITNSINLNDGFTTKIIWIMKNANTPTCLSFDFIVKLDAGDSLSFTSSAGSCVIAGSVRQIANIAGELV